MILICGMRSLLKKDKVLHVPAKSVINKMKSPWAESTDGFGTFSGWNYEHFTQSDPRRRFTVPWQQRLNSEELLPEQDGKSAIIFEMSPIVHVASCSTDIENLSDFAVIIYHHVAKLRHVYDPVDLIFDRYFQESIGTRNDRDSGSMFVFE